MRITNFGKDPDLCRPRECSVFQTGYHSFNPRIDFTMHHNGKRTLRLLFDSEDERMEFACMVLSGVSTERQREALRLMADEVEERTNKLIDF